MWETKTVRVLLPVILLIAASFCQVQTEKKVAHRSDIKNQRHKKTSTRMIVSKVAKLIQSLISFRHLISNKELCLKFKFFGNARRFRILFFYRKNQWKRDFSFANFSSKSDYIEMFWTQNLKTKFLQIWFFEKSDCEIWSFWFKYWFFQVLT